MDSYNPEDVDNALVEFIAERNKIQFEAFIASHPEAQLKCGGGFIFDPGRLSTTAAAELKAIKQSSCPTRLDRLGRFLFCTRATLMRLEISLAMSQYVDHDRAELAEMKKADASQIRARIDASIRLARRLAVPNRPILTPTVPVTTDVAWHYFESLGIVLEALIVSSGGNPTIMLTDQSQSSKLEPSSDDLTLTEFANVSGLSKSAVNSRVKNGMPMTLAAAREAKAKGRSATNRANAKSRAESEESVNELMNAAERDGIKKSRAKF